jgi:tRNA pseudouridine13 synthase
MKIKVRPEDFLVQEEATLRPTLQPRAHAVFRLKKQGWDTFGLIDLFARRLKIPMQDISTAGIKDRHGKTEQLLSIRNRRGLPASVRALAPQQNFHLEFLGYHPTAVTAADIRGNRFKITIRDIATEDGERIGRNAEIVRRWGVPNYFDEQRFGSARHGKGFMGREIFRGSRERALRLYFEPSKFDDPRVRALKSSVLENWYHWERCLPNASGEIQRLLVYLSEHRRAFHKALGLIDRSYLVFVLNAYQSFLFNRILFTYLEELQKEHGFAADTIPYSQGRFLLHRELPEALFGELQRTSVPVPGWNSQITDPRIAGIVAQVLEQEEIGLSVSRSSCRRISLWAR